MTKAIIFDLDGTLLRTHCHSIKAAHHALSTMHLPAVSDETVARHIGDPADVFLRALAPEVSDLAAFEAIFDEMEQKALKDSARLFEGVPELLSHLTQSGYSLAICSNGSRDYVKTALAVTGIYEQFSFLACAGEYPNKSNALAAIIRFLHCDCAVMIGDRHHDLDAAKENGIPFIAAGYGYGGLELAEAKYRAEKPEDILPLLSKIWREDRP